MKIHEALQIFQLIDRRKVTAEAITSLLSLSGRSIGSEDATAFADIMRTKGHTAAIPHVLELAAKYDWMEPQSQVEHTAATCPNCGKTFIAAKP